MMVIIWSEYLWVWKRMCFKKNSWHADLGLYVGYPRNPFRCTSVSCPMSDIILICYSSKENTKVWYFQPNLSFNIKKTHHQWKFLYSQNLLNHTSFLQESLYWNNENAISILKLFAYCTSGLIFRSWEGGISNQDSIHGFLFWNAFRTVNLT